MHSKSAHPFIPIKAIAKVSNSLSMILLNNGLSGSPCGIPTSVFSNIPLSMTLTSRYLWISKITLRSLIVGDNTSMSLFDFTAQWTPLALGMSFPLLGQTKDFHPLECAHAGHSKNKRTPMGCPYFQASALLMC